MPQRFEEGTQRSSLGFAGRVMGKGAGTQPHLATQNSTPTAVKKKYLHHAEQTSEEAAPQRWHAACALPHPDRKALYNSSGEVDDAVISNLLDKSLR